MPPRQLCFLATLLALAFPLHAFAADQPAGKPAKAPRVEPPVLLAPTTIVMKDIAFVPNPDPAQKLDVYTPAGVHDAPIIVYVHRGEWARGDKSEVAAKPRFFNEHGVIFISTNYRLSGVAHHPAQVRDVSSALKWAFDHAQQIGGDPHRIYLMGHSAGCHIVTLVGLDPRWLAEVGLKPTDLAGVVSWSGGAYDLNAKVAENGMYARYIRIDFGTDPAQWRDASPMNHVTDAKKLPPFFFASAEHDHDTSIHLTQKLAQKIRDAGGTAQFSLLLGKTHRTANNDVGEPGDDTGDQILQFMGPSGR